MKNKKDVLFLCQFFHPEYNSSATLPFDTAKYLAASGLSVDALCGYPKEYNPDGKVPVKETVEGVNIHRIRYLSFSRKSRIGRLLNYFSLTFRAFLRLGKLRKYKCVIVYSNPPLLPEISAFANRLFKTKIVFVAYDLYPEVAYASDSVKRGSLIDKFMKRVNRSMFKRASRVVALTDEMREFILKSRPQITPDRVVTIPNWAHEKTCDISFDTCRKFGFEPDDFIVAYFGNMGIVQEMETLLDAIDLLKNEEYIKFFFVGHGSKMDYVKERLAEVPGAKVFDFLRGVDFEEAVAVSSCCTVTLEAGVKGMCAPSKYYSYLQGSKPVIAVTEAGSYLQDEISSKRIGAAVNIGESKQLAELIRQMSNDRVGCEEMGRRAYELYKTDYDIDVCLSKYVELIKELIK